jgi:hypothetical protein
VIVQQSLPLRPVRLWKTFRFEPNAVPVADKRCSPSHPQSRSPSTGFRNLMAHAELHIPESLRPPTRRAGNGGHSPNRKVSRLRSIHGICFPYVASCRDRHGNYYVHLTGRSFGVDGISRNWGAYIQALNQHRADTKITTFLDHIRSQYRDPQSHPSENVDLEEVFALFWHRH